MMNTTNHYKNPLLRGFYPDPSLCRNGEDYYLVTSSMEFFPGIPVFHSRDLVHWTQLGHVLTDPHTFDLGRCEPSGGIMAPTIRYGRGRYYVTSSCEGKGLVSVSSDPAKGWSAPVWLDAPGIDHSLFFDDDGSCYYHGNCPRPQGERFAGDRVIWMQRMDPQTLTLYGERKIIYEGSGTWCEAPHIYKKDGWYYLICAEGGTYRNHCVVCARAANVWGPYQPCPRNPLLSSRHLSRCAPIQNVGHLDMVQTSAGEWWAVALGSRPYGGWDDSQSGDDLAGYFRNLGRETFLLPMQWERGWPVFCPQTGKVELEGEGPALPQCKTELALTATAFTEGVLGMEWNFIRTPKERWWEFVPQGLALRLQPQTLGTREQPAFLGRRQQHMRFTAQTVLEFCPLEPHEQAGLVLYHNDNAYLSCCVGLHNGKPILQVERCFFGERSPLASVFLAQTSCTLRVCVVDQSATFYVQEGASTRWLTVAEGVSLTELNSDSTRSHTGSYVGIYATANGIPSSRRAIFRFFAYTGED